jgi:hypothetical protein
VRNDRKVFSKTFGWFWTSSYDPEYGSGWVRWCMAYRYHDLLDLRWTVLSVPESARVAVIDLATDLATLIKRYPRAFGAPEGLDFERISEDYDGLQLTHRGYMGTRSQNYGPKFMGWDCESTIWFRWVFSEWHEVEPHLRDADRLDDLGKLCRAGPQKTIGAT